MEGISYAMNDSEKKILAETNNSDAPQSAFTRADLKRTFPAQRSIFGVPHINSDQPFTSSKLQARDSPSLLVNGIERFRTKSSSFEVQRTHTESSEDLATAQANADEAVSFSDGTEDSISKHSSLEVRVVSLGDSEDSTDDHTSKEFLRNDLSFFNRGSPYLSRAPTTSELSETAPRLANAYRELPTQIDDRTSENPTPEIDMPLSPNPRGQRKKPPPNIVIPPYQYRPYHPSLKQRIMRRLKPIKTGFGAIVSKMFRKKRA